MEQEEFLPVWCLVCHARHSLPEREARSWTTWPQFLCDDCLQLVPETHEQTAARVLQSYAANAGERKSG